MTSGVPAVRESLVCHEGTQGAAARESRCGHDGTDLYEGTFLYKGAISARSPTSKGGDARGGEDIERDGEEGAAAAAHLSSPHMARATPATEFHWVRSRAARRPLLVSTRLTQRKTACR